MKLLSRNQKISTNRTPQVKIKKLTSENVKRLSIVEITPDGALVTIGGKNGAGKSSVLDSIAYVLGGEKLVPSQPIRTGEKSASIKLELDGYIVTRRFTRDVINQDEIDAAVAKKNSPEGRPSDSIPPPQFGPTKSTITVTNPEGAKYPSPQALLDKLYGKLSFDPLAFSREKDTVQNDILRRIVGLNFAAVDIERKLAFDQRAIDKKTLGIEENKLANLPKHPSKAGVLETGTQDIDELSTRLRLGQTIEAEARDAQSAADAHRIKLDGIQREHDQLLKMIENLKRQLELAEADLATSTERMAAQKAAVAQHDEIAKQRKDAVPDFGEIHAQLSAVNRTNEQARDNKAYLAQEERVKSMQAKIYEGTKAIEKIDADKAAALQSAKFPVEGLSLTDDGVTFEGLPLQEVSASVQLRVSIAIGLALNPALKVLLIRNGNLLDGDSLKLVAEQAEAAGAQVWMEYVTDSADGVSVMLEDGHIA